MNSSCSICLDNKCVIPENSNLDLYRCKLCRHVFKDIAKEEQEKYEGDHFLDKHKNWFSNPDYPLFEFISREMLKRKGDVHLRVLDVRCGIGNFLKR